MQSLLSTPATPRWQWLALAVSALLLGACSNTPIEQSAGGLSRAAPVQLDTAATLPTEACSLLTAGEVSALTGQPVRQQAQGEACRFVEAGKAESPAAVVTVSFRPAAAFAVAQAGNRMRRFNMRPVSGLGREAYYDADHGDLYVQLPARTLVIGLPREVRGNARGQVAPKLGRLALARLAGRAGGAPAR